MGLCSLRKHRHGPPITLDNSFRASTTMAGFCVFVGGRVGVAAENAADSQEVRDQNISSALRAQVLSVCHLFLGEAHGMMHVGLYLTQPLSIISHFSSNITLYLRCTVKHSEMRNVWAAVKRQGLIKCFGVS